MSDVARLQKMKDEIARRKSQHDKINGKLEMLRSRLKATGCSKPSEVRQLLERKKKKLKQMDAAIETKLSQLEQLVFKEEAGAG